jgi:sugar phosphate isomerase/epimerase
MRYGVCAGIEAAPALADAGYDYIELAVAADLTPDADEAAWAAKRSAILSMLLPVEAFNSFVRAHRIVGPDADPIRLRRYVETALRRAAEVGGKIVVFGSGGARNVPEGFDLAVAMRQILEFLHLCADAAERSGVTVAIEPLCRAECNIINRVSEGAELAREVGRPGVRNLADSYHMEAEGEPLSAIVDSADVLAHVHTADTGRHAPGTGVYDHVALFRALHAAEYDARLSIECGFKPEHGDFPTQITRALAHLKAAAASGES